MFYLWKSETNNNILIDRLKTKQAVLRSQNDGVVLPLLKATNTKLSSIFSDINGCHENHAARLEWYDTANIITHILHDDASLKMYKPSSMMYYSISISGEKNLNFVTVEFAVYYHIWKIVDNDQPKPEFKDIVTETIHYCYTFTAEQYKDILLLITIYNREVAEQLLEKSNNPDSDISSGKSAFEIWKELGNEGDESDFIASLKGEDGKSAYQLWLDNGNKGTVSDFLDSLKGENGASAYEIWKALGNEGDENDFINSLKDSSDNGENGKSAYEIWKELGNEGDESDFIASLKGEDGEDGKSAYQLWLEDGNEGTVSDFFNSLRGENGKSAYQLWLEDGNEGTVSDFLDSLKGTDGESVYELYVSSGGTLSEEEFQNSLVNPVQWGSFS